MNYKIIYDERILNDFIEWLPEIEEGECFYVALFARKKYHNSAKNDKSQCKRFTATSKKWLLKKIKQLEIVDNAYTNKDGTSVHEKSLALYISVNPRNFAIAQRQLLKKLADTLSDQRKNMNPASLALSEIQKAKSRTVYVDFDFDGVNYNDLPSMKTIVNEDACHVLKTRGGFHLLVNPGKVAKEFRSTWYQKLSSIPACDVSGDSLIPIAGCAQGGFMPYMEK